MHYSRRYLVAVSIFLCCLSSKVLAQSKDVKAKATVSSKEIVQPKPVVSIKNTVDGKSPLAPKKVVESKPVVQTKNSADAKVAVTTKKVADLQVANLKDGISTMPLMPVASNLPTPAVVDTVALLKDLKVKPFKVNSHASYYHDKLNGRRTASGKPFDNKKFTAAHRTLPFGTKLKLTNPANNKSIVVEVNDRGPFTKSREIDITKAAFMEITSNKNSGSVIITIEVIQ